jgi:DNA polymerase-1
VFLTLKTFCQKPAKITAVCHTIEKVAFDAVHSAMTDEFPYEVLFHWAFPEWKGEIPPMPQSTRPQPIFLTDDVSDSDSDPPAEPTPIPPEPLQRIFQGTHFLWEIKATNGWSNMPLNRIPNSDDPAHYDLASVTLHIPGEPSIELSPDDSVEFDADSAHFLPNACWVFSIFPNFREDLVFFDPILAAWYKNTETFVKPEIIHGVSLFGTNGDLFTGFISIYNEMQQIRWLFETEMPHLRILGRMHQSCLSVDVPKLTEARSALTADVSRLSKEIYGMAGREFNILSPFEVSEVLFTDLGIPNASGQAQSFSIDSRHRVTKHREFAPTSSAILEKIEHPIAAAILKYRRLQKLISTWLSFDGKCDANGVLHPDFHVCATATGRVSTTNPNMQNIPGLSDDLNVRSFFTAGEDKLLISLDYCQLELRMLAHFSRDVHLCRLCRSADFDLHAHIANLIFNVAAPTPGQREEAKQSIYATIYGKGWSKDGIEKGEKLEAVLDAFPAIRDFAARTTGVATRQGFVETLCGKRRYLPNLSSENPMNRKRDQRMAINTVIQGSAADFVKFALVKIVREMQGEDLEPLLQLHDEWIFRTGLRPETREFGGLVERLRVAASAADEMGIIVPIPCKIKWGATYGDLA